MESPDLSRVRVALERAQDLGDSNPEGALRLLDEAIPAQLRRYDPMLSGQVAYFRARLLAILGRYSDSLSAIRTARRDHLTAGDRLGALRTDLGRATVIQEMSDYTQSIAVSRRLLHDLNGFEPASDRVAECDSIRARAHSNLANALCALDNHSEGAHQYDLASNLFESLGEEDKCAETDANRGLVHLRMGMIHQALEELVAARDRLQRLDNRLAAAKCGTDIAEAYLELGHVTMAIAEIEEAHGIFAALRATPEQARAELMLSRAMLRAGMVREAAAQAENAADIFSELSMVDESARATLTAAMAAMNAGNLEDSGRGLAVAELLFLDSGDEAKAAEVWLAQAQLARRLNDRQAAVQLATKAAGCLGRNGVLLPTALARITAAELTDDLTAAAVQLADADTIAETLRIPSLRFMVGLAIARHRKREDKCSEAAQILRDLLESPELLPGDVDEPRLRLAHQSVHDEATDTLIEILLGNATHRSTSEAWQYATWGQSRVLNEFVERARLREPELFTESLSTNEPYGLWDLAALSLSEGDHASGKSGSADAPLLRRKPSKAKESVGRFFKVPPPSTIRAKQQPLPAIPEGPLLQYRVLEKDIVVYLVRDGIVEARRLPGATEKSLNALDAWRAECARESLTHIRRRVGEDATAQRTIDRLSDLLIAPIADLLEDLEGQPLLVIPHRHLHAVPFEALGCDNTSMSSRFELRFALGLSPTPQEVPPWPGKGTLVLAVPDDAAPKIAVEAHAIADGRSDVELLIGPQATAHQFAQRAPGMNIVHIACHGLFETTSPFASSLMLADRRVTAREIIELDLRDSLVVLSACSSGESSASLTEPAGLAWAFLAAGARGVIASNWMLDDATALELIPKLHAHLAAGVLPAEALRRASIATAQTHAHPYHWAAFRYICSTVTALTEGIIP